MTNASAFWLQAPGRGAILEEALPPPPPGFCTVQTMFSALSPGTERLIAGGHVPPELYDEMRCPYMGGAFPFPVKYGYSVVGRIIDSPGQEGQIGRTVHLLHPHQDFCPVRIEDAYLVPENIPAERATLASNLETAVNAVWDSQVSAGERVLVVGFGIIGSLVARLLGFFPGAEVEVAERDPEKAELARRLGFDLAPTEKAARPFDLAFHASGSPEGLQLAIDSVGFEGRVVELSWFGTKSATLALGGRFHSQRKSILSSQVSAISARMRSRWDKNRRKELVFRLLQRPEFDAHISHTISFSQLPAVFGDFESLAGGALSVLVKY
jgi:threonine dehydrogenase-like Zn-dependent dehydrogenase